MRRRTFLAAGTLAAASSAARAQAAAPQRVAPATTFLVCHGAWSAGWAWKKMHPLLSAMGHRLVTPTYTGLGEREHLATPSVDLDTHIQDILNVIRFEQLDRFVLIGHSYGGMVATGVADRVPERITRLVYLDAFVPRDGQSLADLNGGDAAQRMRAAASSATDWRVAPNPPPPDTSVEDRNWIDALRIAQPARTFTSPVRLMRGETRVPRTYVKASRIAPGDGFERFAARAREEGWDYRDIDASHSPHVTAPEALARLLNAVAAGAKPAA